MQTLPVQRFLLGGCLPSQESQEYQITRNYLDWLTGMPWGVYSKDGSKLLGPGWCFRVPKAAQGVVEYFLNIDEHRPIGSGPNGIVARPGPAQAWPRPRPQPRKRNLETRATADFAVPRPWNN